MRRRHLLVLLAVAMVAALVVYWHTIVVAVSGFVLWRLFYRAAVPGSRRSRRRGGAADGFRKWVDTGAIALIAANTYPVRKLPASVQRRVKARGARA